MCPKCTQQQRVGNLKILDVIVPQVFFSYNWGKCSLDEDGSNVYSTQQSVIPLRNRVELSSDLLVRLDVYRSR